MLTFPLTLLLVSVVASSAQQIPAVPGEPLFYKDNFNKAEPFFWTMFEESAATIDCGITGVGRVERSTEIRRKGKGGLMVASNYDNVASGSNHVLAQRQLANVGLTGKISYTVWSYVDTAVLPATQTGPEMSLQSTRPVELDGNGNPIYRTFIGGLQYVGNSYISNKWNIWAYKVDSTEATDAEIAEWTPIGEVLGIPELSIDGWWKITFVVDFTKNKYIKLKLTDPTEVTTTYNLRDYEIARELKFHEGSFGATLESQNLYVSDCSGINTHRAYYDNVRIVQKGDAVVPMVPVLELDKRSEVVVGESTDLEVGDNIILTILDFADIGALEINEGTLTYIATQPTEVGIKYRACDKTTFLCSEAWWTVSVPNHAPEGASKTVSTEACGTTISIASPITDVDNNIDWSKTVILEKGGCDDPSNPCPASVGSAENTFDFAVPTNGNGELGFLVQVEDTWGWNTAQWITVSWACL